MAKKKKLSKARRDGKIIWNWKEGSKSRPNTTGSKEMRENECREAGSIRSKREVYKMEWRMDKVKKYKLE